MSPRGNEPELHSNATAHFTALVHRIKPDDWGRATPCPEWTVRDLVGHLVSEARWTAPLLAGRTIADVGDSLDGDLLGDDPVAAWDAAAQEATAAVHAPGALDGTAHLSFGDFPASEYLRQLIADHLVHAWDLARAIGADDSLDPEVTAAVADWWSAEMEAAYRGAGAVGARPTGVTAGTPQERLLVAFGRSPTWTPSGLS